MEAILKDINAVSGVIGCFVYDEEGLVLASGLPSLFDETILGSTGRTITNTIAGLAMTRRRKIGDIDLIYTQGRLIVKNLGEGCLCILSIRNINLPLLNLTANMAVKKLTAIFKENKRSLKREGKTHLPLDAHSLMLNDEVQSIITAAQERKVVIRAAGDAAIRLCCPSASNLTTSLDDKVLDFVGLSKQSKQIIDLFENHSYAGEHNFNALYGEQRLRFYNAQKNLGVEVFLNVLSMHHQLNFADRLDINPTTIPIVDLLLWKLQYIEPDEGVLKAIYTILSDYELGETGEGEKIDKTHVLDLCKIDWGWYKTVTTNLNKSISWAEQNFDDQASIFFDQARELLRAIEDEPKSVGWQLRARLGESIRWYEVPE